MAKGARKIDRGHSGSESEREGGKLQGLIKAENIPFLDSMNHFIFKV